MKHLETGDADYHAGMQDMSDMSHEMMTSASGDGGHKEYFYWTNQVSLFVKVFDVNSTQGICVAAFVFALLTIILEGFKCIRVKIAEKAGDRTYGCRMCSRVHILQSIVYQGELFLNYTLMLAVMTFNGWLFLSVLFGAAVGFTLCQLCGIKHRYGAPPDKDVDGPPKMARQISTSSQVHLTESDNNIEERQQMDTVHEHQTPAFGRQNSRRNSWPSTPDPNACGCSNPGFSFESNL